MIVQTVKYVDLNGEEVSDKLYFNLNSLEATRMEAKYTNKVFKTMQDYLQHIVDEGDNKAIVEAMEDVILSAYGERSADGKHFMKTKEIRTNFENSLAYAQLFDDLIRDEQTLTTFINGIVQKRDDKAAKATQAARVE